MFQIAAGPGGGGIPMMPLYGNPGDYAWGRGGFDSIVTQLLNQMDGTGPPPMSGDDIKRIPTVKVTQSQIDANLQVREFQKGTDFNILAKLPIITSNFTQMDKIQGGEAALL